MITETLISALGGGLLRMVPEVLAHFDKKNERKHELSMADKQLEFAKAKGSIDLQVAQETHAGQVEVGMVHALVEATKAQAKPTGIKWVDALSAMVRPSITLSFFLLYACVKVHWIFTGNSQLWTDDDWNIMSAIFMFWFCGRPWEKWNRK